MAYIIIPPYTRINFQMFIHILEYINRPIIIIINKGTIQSDPPRFFCQAWRVISSFFFFSLSSFHHFLSPLLTLSLYFYIPLTLFPRIF